jgi:hypothetical protein
MPPRRFYFEIANKREPASRPWSQLKGYRDIGINTQVIQPMIDANSRLARSDFADFNDSKQTDKKLNLVSLPRFSSC